MSRIYKVHRHPDKTQSVTEMTVCSMLEGDIEASWTKADNANIVATDTQKQTVYVMAKQHPVNPPELFGAILAQHYIDTYDWITKAHIWITVHRWTRLEVDGKPHPHSFMRDGEEKRLVECTAERSKGINIRSGIKGLLVLKSTGSQFWGYHKDEYTRLPETWDRILSTEVEAGWRWHLFKDVAEVEKEQDAFDQAWKDTRTITLETFATEDSPSVQNTMYLMSEQILEKVPGVDAVEYSLPNKHYFEIGEFGSQEIVMRIANVLSRSQLVQGPQEYRRGCGGVCTPERSEWHYPMYGDETGIFIQVVKAFNTGVYGCRIVYRPRSYEHRMRP